MNLACLHQLLREVESTAFVFFCADHFSFLCRMLCLYISVASKHHARERNYGQFGHWMSEMDWTLQSVPVVTRTTVIPWFFDYASTRTEPIAVPAIALCKWMKLRLQQKDGMEDDEGGETHEHIDASLFSCASAVSLAVAGLDRYVKDASADDGMWANIKFLQECAERSKNKYVIMMTGISLFRRTLLAAADPESTIYRSVATGGCDQSTFLLATFNLMFSLLNDHAQAEASSLSFGDNAVAFLGNAATIVQNVGKHGGSTFEFTYGFDSAGSALQILDKALQLINMITTTANCDQRGTGSVASSLRPDGCVRGLRSFHSAVHQALVQLTRLPKGDVNDQNVRSQVCVSCINLYLTLLNCDGEHCEHCPSNRWVCSVPESFASHVLRVHPRGRCRCAGVGNECSSNSMLPIACASDTRMQHILIITHTLCLSRNFIQTISCLTGESFALGVDCSASRQPQQHRPSHGSHLDGYQLPTDSRV